MKDTGGPAFPGYKKVVTKTVKIGSTDVDVVGKELVEGMTLRDYFIGQLKPAIIQGLMLRYKDPGYTDLAMLNEAHVLAEKEVSKMINERNK